jgi:uncharacterized membrane protein
MKDIFINRKKVRKMIGETGNLITAGIILIIIGIMIITIAALISESSKKTSFGFGGFIGPIVFGFGNDPRMVKFAVIMSLILLAVFIVLIISRV